MLTTRPTRRSYDSRGKFSKSAIQESSMYMYILLQMKILRKMTSKKLVYMYVRLPMKTPRKNVAPKICIYLYTFGDENLKIGCHLMMMEKSRRQECLNWIITWIFCFESTFYFLLNRILIFNKEPKYLIFSYQLLPAVICTFVIMPRWRPTTIPYFSQCIHYC